jgi:hypothetical protein
MEETKLVLTKSNGVWNVSYVGREVLCGKDHQTISIALIRWFMRYFRSVIVSKTAERAKVEANKEDNNE